MAAPAQQRPEPKERELSWLCKSWPPPPPPPQLQASWWRTYGELASTNERTGRDCLRGLPFNQARVSARRRPPMLAGAARYFRSNQRMKVAPGGRPFIRPASRMPTIAVVVDGADERNSLAFDYAMNGIAVVRTTKTTHTNSLL